MADLNIAAVVGDDVLSQIGRYLDRPMLETGQPIRTIEDKIVSANAYIGGAGISQALAAGADIVITGRAADPSLFSGPLMFEFSKPYSDFHFLGQTIAAGHLLECAGQVTGGYFADPGIKDVPELWHLPFPILTFRADGSFALEKLPDTGGLLNAATVKEQLLYEIEDPANYLTPDAVADFTAVTIRETADGRVELSGATGKPKTGLLKVSIGYRDGFIGEGEISYGGQNCVARAQLAEEIIRKRLEIIGLKPREARFDLVGLSSLYGRDFATLPPHRSLNEVRLRVTVRAEEKKTAEAVGREVEALYVNGPAGGGGVRKGVKEVIAIASVLIPAEDVSLFSQLCLIDQKCIFSCFGVCILHLANLLVTEPEKIKLKLYKIAHSRAGDKGNRSTISVIAYDPADYPMLVDGLTSERVLRHFRPIGVNEVERYELPNLCALNFVLGNALGGGVTRSLALDTHGKTLSHFMLEIELLPVA